MCARMYTPMFPAAHTDRQTPTAANNIKKEGSKKRRYFTFYGIIAYLGAGETAVEGL